MSKDFTTTDSGEATINNLNISRSSDNEKPRKLLTLPILQNIRRKRRATKTERDQLLQTIDDRSVYQISEVDLGFLEKKREVLKKKQQLLNRTLLANKLSQQVKRDRKAEEETKENATATLAEQCAVENCNDDDDETTMLQTKHEEPTDETTHLNTTPTPEHISQVTSNKHDGTSTKAIEDGTNNLQNEAGKTTFNFNIYKAEINRKLLRSKALPLMNESKEPITDETLIDRNNESAIEPVRADHDAKIKNESSLQDKKGESSLLPQSSRDFLLKLISCRTLVSVVFYILVLLLVLLFSLTVYKFNSSSSPANKHGKQEHKLHHIHHKHPNDSHLHHSSNVLKDNLSQHDGKLLKDDKSRLINLIYELANATVQNANYTEKPPQLPRVQQQQHQQQQIYYSPIGARIDLPRPDTRNPMSYFDPQGQQYFWHVENDVKRQNIPTVQTIIHKPPSTPMTSTTTTKPPTPSTTTTVTTTTLDPVLLKANNVLNSLNIGHLSPSYENNQPTRDESEFYTNHPSARIADISSRSSVTKHTTFNSPSPSAAYTDYSPEQWAFRNEQDSYRNQQDHDDGQQFLSPIHHPAEFNRPEDDYRYTDGVYPLDNNGRENFNRDLTGSVDQRNEENGDNIMRHHSHIYDQIGDVFQEKYADDNPQEDKEHNIEDSSSHQDSYYPHQKEQKQKQFEKMFGKSDNLPDDFLSALIRRIPDIPTTLRPSKTLASPTKPKVTTTTTAPTTPTTSTTTTTTTTTATTTTITPVTTTTKSTINPEVISQFTMPKEHPHDPLEKAARRDFKKYHHIYNDNDEVDDDDTDTEDSDEENDDDLREHVGGKEDHQTFIEPDVEDRDTEYNEEEKDTSIHPFDREMKYKNEYIDDDLLHRKTLEDNRNFRLATLRTTKRAYEVQPKTADPTDEDSLDFRRLQQLSNKPSYKTTDSAEEDSLDFRRLQQLSKKQSEKISGLEKVVKLLQTNSKQGVQPINDDRGSTHSDDLMKTDGDRYSNGDNHRKDVSFILNDDDLMSMSNSAKNDIATKDLPRVGQSSTKKMTDTVVNSNSNTNKTTTTTSVINNNKSNNNNNSNNNKNDDLMKEFVEFVKVRHSLEKSKQEKRKPIPKPKPTKKPKVEVKTYKLKTCIELKTFAPGELVQIVKGPNKSKGKISYTVRSCTKKSGKRFFHMKCKDIIYKISTGKLQVKEAGKKGGKRIYAVYGCRNDDFLSKPPTKRGLVSNKKPDNMAENTENEGNDNSEDGDDRSEESGSGSESKKIRDDDEDDDVEEQNRSWSVDEETVNQQPHTTESNKQHQTKESKQLVDLMSMVKDMKKELHQQRQSRQPLHKTVVAKKKKNIPHRNPRKSRVHKSDQQDDRENDGDNEEDDKDYEDKDYSPTRKEITRHHYERDNNREEEKNEEERDSEVSQNYADNDGDNDNDRDNGDEDDRGYVKEDKHPKRKSKSKTWNNRSHVSKVDTDDVSNDNDDDDDDTDDDKDTTPSQRKASTRPTAERRHHSNHNNSEGDDSDADEDDDEEKEEHRISPKKRHHDTTSNHDNDNDNSDNDDDDDDDDEDEQVVGSDGEDDDDAADENDDKENEKEEEDDHRRHNAKKRERKHTERSSIPYHSHIRKFRQASSPFYYGNQEDEDGMNENELTRSSNVYDNGNLDDDDEEDKNTSEEYPENNKDENQEKLEEQEQGAGDDTNERDLMYRQLSEEDASNQFMKRQPTELTYNGVKYVAKNPEFTSKAPYIHSDLESSDGESESNWNQNKPLSNENIMMNSFQNPNSNQQQNIENVIRAILPEVVKTVSNEKALVDLTKRNSIPDGPINSQTSTTTPTPTTHRRPSTTYHHPPTTIRPHTTMRSKKDDDTNSSTIDMIIKGLKALGLSENRKNQQRDKRTSKSVTVQPSSSPPTKRTTTTTTTITTTTKPTTTTPKTTATTELPHETPPTPHIVALHDPREVRILCFGDSLTAGYNKHGKHYFPYCNPLRSILGYHSRLFVFAEAKGITGEMVHKQMTHRLPLVLGNATVPYDWVIILGGTNDILHVKNFGDDDEFLRELENVWQPRILKDIEKLHEIAYRHGSHTMLLTVPENSIETWPDFKPLFLMRKKINEALRDFAYRSKGRTVLCDIAKKIPRHSLSPQNELLLWDDHLHLTPTGYTKMAGAISDCLRPYLPLTTR